jgi:2-haloacid dehalogenase
MQGRPELPVTIMIEIKPSLNDHLAIVFDFGGVIFDWDPRYLYLRFFDGDRQAVDSFLEEIQFAEWNLHQDRGRPFSAAVTEHCARFPQYCDLIRAYDAHWEDSIRGPIDGTLEILGSLAQAGYPLYALSNWSTEKFALIRPRYAFLDWFETILISGSVGIAKPDPQIFTLLFELIERPAGECLVIDDSPQNIQVAQEMGCRTIHFQSPEQLELELSKLGISLAKH